MKVAWTRLKSAARVLRGSVRTIPCRRDGHLHVAFTYAGEMYGGCVRPPFAGSVIADAMRSMQIQAENVTTPIPGVVAEDGEYPPLRGVG